MRGLPDQAAATLRRDDLAPTIGLILGSGLGDVVGDMVEAPRRTPFADVPGMPAAGVVGHAGELVTGRIAGRDAVVMRGRIHVYEGHSAATVAYPVRVMAALGCTNLIVTNAAGGINPSFLVGDLMAITDHIFLPGLAGANPLVAANGERFIDMIHCYDPDLVRRAVDLAARAGFALRTGVYAMVSGPSFETAAELRFLKTIGADAVGMSTAPEVVVARQLGMRVFGISCITNQAFPDANNPVDHAEVLAAGALVRPRMAALIAALLDTL